MNCRMCSTPLPKDKIRCPSCKCWNYENAALGDDDDTVLLSDATLSEVKRIDVDFLNDVFGGGLAQTSVNLIAGPPGAGKTTLFLQLADTITKLFPQPALYIATEQQAEEIKTTAIRIQVENKDKIRIVKAIGGLKRNLWDYFEKYKPSLIIIDSLTMLCAENLDLQVKVAEDIKKATLELRCPSLLVNQVNKQEDHAGLMKLQHAVDALFMLDKDDFDGERLFYSKKNRFGPAPKAVELLMTPEDADIPGMLVPKNSNIEDEE